MSHLEREIAAQPDAWRRAAAMAPEAASALGAPGERVAVIGCGTSRFIALAYARLREAAGHGETDSFAASELPPERTYDRVIAITRSGTTTEVLRALEAQAGRTRRVAVTADAATDVEAHVDAYVELPFADERSMVQTLFATTVLALLRAHVGTDLEPIAAQAQRALAQEMAPELVANEQITLVGIGWAEGLAHEGALKIREAAQAWTESYSAMEYRHGPVAIAAPGRTFWCLGEAPPGLLEQVAATGATVVHDDEDAMASLVRVQRLAGAIAAAKGLDPDRPRNLTRSIVLPT